MAGSATRVQAALRSLRVLVVEDEYMIAAEIAEMLSEAGATIVGPMPSVDKAMRLILAENRIDCAALDVNVRGETVWLAVAMLLARDMPVMLSTGYDAAAIPLAYAHLPRCEKPTSQQDLVRTLAQAVTKAAFP